MNLYIINYVYSLGPLSFVSLCMCVCIQYFLNYTLYFEWVYMPEI